MRLAGLIWLVFANVAVQASDQKKPCATADAIRAEQQASSLRTWQEVYMSFRNFAQCDDGAIGEGYSDSVARLLSDHWNGTSQLNHFVKRDKAFENFVLRHVDELMSPTQAEKIRKNAESSCPPNSKTLCDEIAARIREIKP
jgi:hypothetical protein